MTSFPSFGCGSQTFMAQITHLCWAIELAVAPKEDQRSGQLSTSTGHSPSLWVQPYDLVAGPWMLEVDQKLISAIRALRSTQALEG